MFDPSQWTNLNSGFDVDVTNGVDNFVMTIDADTDIFGTTVPEGTFNLIGIGGQFDRDAPFTDGYQIIPRYQPDIDLLTSTIDRSLKESHSHLS